MLIFLDSMSFSVVLKRSWPRLMSGPEVRRRDVGRYLPKKDISKFVVRVTVLRAAVALRFGGATVVGIPFHHYRNGNSTEEAGGCVNPSRPPEVLTKHDEGAFESGVGGCHVTDGGNEGDERGIPAVYHLAIDGGSNEKRDYGSNTR